MSAASIRPRRARREDGYIAYPAIAVMVVMAFVLLGIVQTVSTAVSQSRQGRELAEARAGITSALADINYQVNLLAPSQWPNTADPRTGHITDRGRWSWHVTGGVAEVTSVSGQTRQVVDVPLRTLPAVAASTGDLGPVYTVDHEFTWTTALAATDATTIAGTVTGGLALFGHGDIEAATISAGADIDTVTAYKDSINYTGQTPATRASLTAMLDDTHLDAIAAHCGDGTAWVASEQGAVLSAGEVGCYSTMTFDVPTTVVGAAPAFVYASDRITVSADVNVYGSTQLHLFARTAESVSFTRDVTVRAHLYAPEALCATTAETSIHYSGAMTCRSVRARGQFLHVEPSQIVTRVGSSTITPVFYADPLKEAAR